METTTSSHIYTWRRFATGGIKLFRRDTSISMPRKDRLRYNINCTAFFTFANYQDQRLVKILIRHDFIGTMFKSSYFTNMKSAIRSDIIDTLRNSTN